MGIITNNRMTKLKFTLFFACLLFATSAFSQTDKAQSDSYLNTGYKGMVDIGYGIGTSKWGTGRIELATTHGYHFFPFLYAGVGIGANYYHDRKAWSIPVFANIRGYLPLSDPQLSPFADIRVGYSVADIDGFYFSPSIGLRYGVNEQYGLAFSIGYEIQNFNTIDLPKLKKKDNSAFTMRFSFDF